MIHQLARLALITFFVNNGLFFGTWAGLRRQHHQIYINRIFGKLGATNRTQAVARAHGLHLL